MESWILIGKIMDKNRIDKYVFESSTNMTKMLDKSSSIELIKKSNVLNAKVNGSNISCTWFSNTLLPTYKIVNGEPVQVKGMSKEEIYAMANEVNNSKNLQLASESNTEIIEKAKKTTNKENKSSNKEIKEQSNKETVSKKKRKTPADLIFGFYEWFKKIVYRGI